MSAILQPLKWFYHEFGVVSIHETGRDAYLMILARTTRMFAYGTSSLILAIFFSALEYSDHRIGIFMTLTLLGDVFLGTFLTLIADRVGRRRVLIGGSLLMIMSGTTFAIFENFWILLLAAIFGVISVTGGDFGPFRSIEESVLSQLTTSTTRSDVLSWYVTTSTLGASLGSEASGRIIPFLQSLDGWTEVRSYHAIFWVYTVSGIANLVMVLSLTDQCELPEGTYTEVPQHESERVGTTHGDGPSDSRATKSGRLGWTARLTSWLTSHLSQISAQTRSTMYKFWFLLGVDALADGMVPYSLTNYYMDTKFNPSKSTLGDITSISYFLSSVGAVFAAPLARRIGLINTMVFTHTPSSTAVLLFPFPPVFWLTAGLLFVRAGLNNMDQAPRAAFIAAVVKPEERTAVMGISTLSRTVSAMAGPTLTGLLAGGERFWIAFVGAGVCRLMYDFGLYALFINTPLNQHEDKSTTHSNGYSDRRAADEEENLELQSLADSDLISSPRDSSIDLLNENSTNTGLQVASQSLRARSRSPRRPG